MAIIRPDQYVELYSALAELMLEANNVDLPTEILLVTEANGDVRYTDAAQERYNDYCDEVEAVLLANNIVGEQYLSENNVDRNLRLLVKATISAVEYNVLQVAIDHMIEHQEGIQLYETEIDPSDDVPCDDAQWDDICSRLEAAKKLKALFS
tara:strand:+ start:277 stop:732 length:456 start_codon:yes stop_codon:yes gene_type:complete